MRKVFELIFIAIAVGLTVEIIKPAIPYLPLIWFVILSYYTWEVITSKYVLGHVNQIRHRLFPGGLMVSYVVVAIVGAALFSFYWWGLNSFFAPKIAAYEAEQHKKELHAPEQSVTQIPQSLARNGVPIQERRIINAQELGLALKDKEPMTAAIWNDGTNEAGTFAQQLVIGLQMAGWQIKGGGQKLADPYFFPDGLTIEISSIPISEDYSAKQAKILVEVLKVKFHIDAVLRYTDQKFPPNFMKIKVAGR